MNEDAQRLQKEIDATAASLEERAREVQARAELVTLGARVLTKQNPWIGVALSMAAGYLAARALLPKDSGRANRIPI